MRAVKQLGNGVAGGALIAAGLGGLMGRFSSLDAVNAVCATTALCWVVIAWGFMFCLAVRFPHAFGLRLTVGLLCFSLAAFVAGYFTDCFIAGTITLPHCILAAVLIGCGWHCLAVKKRVIRHH